MTGRTIVAAAAVGVLTLTTAVTAVAANLGVFQDPDPVGQLTPVVAPEERPVDDTTVYVDPDGNPVPPPGSQDEAVPIATAEPAAPGGDGATTATWDDDHDDDHEDDHGDDDGDDDDHEDDEHEYEGWDDDD